VARPDQRQDKPPRRAYSLYRRRAGGRARHPRAGRRRWRAGCQGAAGCSRLRGA
jgi:hypothetical protein